MPAGTLAIIAAFVGLFLGGGAIGGALAQAFAPGSWTAAVAGFFALPLAFGTGMQAWYGLALLSLIPRLLGRLWGVQSPPPTASSRIPGAGIPGSLIFLPLGSLAGAPAGIVVGLASSTHPTWLVALVFWLVGTAHGGLSWRLARGGFLIPPESI